MNFYQKKFFTGLLGGYSRDVNVNVKVDLVVETDENEDAQTSGPEVKVGETRY